MADVWRCPKPVCGWEGTPGEMAEGGLVSEDCDGMRTRMCPLCGVRDGLRIVHVGSREEQVPPNLGLLGILTWGQLDEKGE